MDGEEAARQGCYDGETTRGDDRVVAGGGAGTSRQRAEAARPEASIRIGRTRPEDKLSYAYSKQFRIILNVILILKLKTKKPNTKISKYEKKPC